MTIAVVWNGKERERVSWFAGMIHHSRRETEIGPGIRGEVAEVECKDGPNEGVLYRSQ